MKFAPAFALLVASASAFTAPTMTFAVGKKSATKVVKKAAPKPKPAAKKAAPVVKKAAPKKAVASAGTINSKAIPYEEAPALLDGSLVGDVGFDPCFLATKADLVTNYFKGIFNGAGPSNGLVWYREAELMHGRIAMMAVVGFIWPGLFGTFSGNEWTGVDAYSTTNPVEALGTVPSAALFQIGAFMSALEFRRINNIIEDGESYIAGNSQRWGQFEGQWNPFGFNYTPAEYEEKALQEIKHSRLAMIGLLGLIFQANASGVSVAEQLGAAFQTPDYYAKAGYFLPEGI